MSSSAPGGPFGYITSTLNIVKLLEITAVLVLFSHILLKRKNSKQVEDAVASQYCCKPVYPYVPYKWPLALDLLKQNYEILFSEHTFESLTPYFNIAKTCCIHLFGVTGYFTTDPENVSAILSDKFEDYSLGSRRLAMHPLIGEGIFTQDGTAWKRSREIIRQQFVRVLKETPEAFASHVDGLITDISEATVGGRVDLKPLMFEYTLNTTTALLFGEPHNSMTKEEADAVRDNFDRASFGCGIRVRLADAAFLYSPAKFRKACRAVRDWATFFASKAINYKDEHGEEAASERYPFIIDLWKEMHDFDLVRDQLLHILIAGRDSTASLLCWTLFHLVRNRGILERLQRDIADIPKEGIITREQIRKVPFLQCCLNEILRLYPTLPMNVRFANKPTILPRGGGPDGKSPVLLSKGAGIVWSVYHLHRLEELYGVDSNVFNPERWESGELMKNVRLKTGFIDFNAGPRTCLGKDYALMEASYAIIRILQTYPKIRLAAGVSNEAVGAEKQSYTIGLYPSEGVEVELY